MTERLAIDASLSYETDFMGKKGDDNHPYSGARIVRVEFHKDIKPKGRWSIRAPLAGKGDAKITETTGSNVRVHYWLEGKTKLTYNLKVWVSD